MTKSKPQILLTNDDGILSPGLWAAASALSKLGFVTVTAPREQASGAGRSLPSTSDGIIEEKRVQVNGQEWSVFSVGGTPAQTVLHAVYEVMKEKPDLVVSGINYGENVATGITISGTVGAAIEAACFDIPALALSLETPSKYHLSHSDEIDFSVAAHFTRYFAQRVLSKGLLPGVDLLKIDVPTLATLQTPWRSATVSRQRYYQPSPPSPTGEAKPFSYQVYLNHERLEPGSDIHLFAVEKLITVVPMTIDMTARVSLQDVDSFFND